MPQQSFQDRKIRQFDQSKNNPSLAPRTAREAFGHDLYSRGSTWPDFLAGVVAGLVLSVILITSAFLGGLL